MIKDRKRGNRRVHVRKPAYTNELGCVGTCVGRNCWIGREKVHIYDTNRSGASYIQFARRAPPLSAGVFLFRKKTPNKRHVLLRTKRQAHVPQNLGIVFVTLLLLLL